MGRTLVIGDVHGCVEELNTLLDTLRLTVDDHVIFAGDLVDKGPDSAGVVRRVRALSKEVKVDIVEGNHESMHIRWMKKDPAKRPDMKRHEEFVAIHANMSEEDQEFLKTALLFVHLPKMGVVVTHGGVPENMKRLPDPRTISGMSRSDQDFYSQMCRLRCVDEKGRFVGLLETKPEHTFWAERYDGRLGHVFFGHQPFMQDDPKEFKFATGIDLGCVHGGMMCAVQLDKDIPNKRSSVFTVRGLRKYAPIFGE